MIPAVNTSNLISGYEIQFKFDSKKGFEPALARVQNGMIQIYRSNGSGYNTYAEAGFVPGKKSGEEECIDVNHDGKCDGHDLRIADNQLQLYISRKKI